MKDGTRANIRPIRPEDEPLMVKFHNMLSERSVMMRYTHQIALSKRVEHERLVRICFNDYDREMALVADHVDPYTGELEIMAVGRMTKVSGTEDAQFAILVADPFQRRGLGSELLHHLMAVAREEKIRHLNAEFLIDNTITRRMCEKLGFRLEKVAGEGIVKAEIAIP
jgi:acetyltransferase